MVIQNELQKAGNIIFQKLYNFLGTFQNLNFMITLLLLMPSCATPENMNVGNHVIDPSFGDN